MGDALKKPRAQDRDPGPSALQLVEECFHQLRSAKAATWLAYALGALPWIFLLLYFWARTTWFAPRSAEIAWEAGALGVAFVGLKTAQARFCQQLSAARVGETAKTYSVPDYIKLSLGQLRLQALGLLLLPLAFAAVVPFAFTFAYFQNLNVLANEPDARSLAWREGMRWQKQNWIALGIIALFSLVVWLNVAIAFYAVPWAANHLLGIENMFAMGGWFALNSTFLVSVTALTWLVTDPLLKSFYVLRLFYGRSQRTGADILMVFQVPRVSGKIVRVALVAMLLCVTQRVAHAESQPKPQVHNAVEPQQLDRAIDAVLRSPEFRWHVRMKDPEMRVAHDGAIRQFLRDTAEFVESIAADIRGWYRRIVRWLEGATPANADPITKKSADSAYFAKTLLIALIVIAAALLIFLIVSSVRSPARRIQSSVTENLPEAVPDLRDDGVQAAQLPTDGWLQLAQREIAKGEWRLALRALYLATLAQLGAEGLISLAKFKTNDEYEKELRRRAPGQIGKLARFGKRRFEYEQIWYGRGVADEPRVRDWLDDFSEAAR